MREGGVGITLGKAAPFRQGQIPRKDSALDCQLPMLQAARVRRVPDIKKALSSTTQCLQQTVELTSKENKCELRNPAFGK